MHEGFSKDEIIVLMSMNGSLAIYALLDGFGLHSNRYFSLAGIIILMLFIAYMCFNRFIKLMILSKKGDFYDSTAVVKDIEYEKNIVKRVEYYKIEYSDAQYKVHEEKVYRYSAVKSWDIGKKLKIKINITKPDKIIIAGSDFAVSLIWLISGIIAEIVLAVFIVFINRHSM